MRDTDTIAKVSYATESNVITKVELPELGGAIVSQQLCRTRELRSILGSHQNKRIFAVLAALALLSWT